MRTNRAIVRDGNRDSFTVVPHTSFQLVVDRMPSVQTAGFAILRFPQATGRFHELNGRVGEEHIGIPIVGVEAQPQLSVDGLHRVHRGQASPKILESVQVRCGMKQDMQAFEAISGQNSG